MMRRASSALPKGVTGLSFSVRYTPAILFAVFSLAVTLYGQTTTKQTVKTPRGSVSGRVTIKDKGAAGVAVGIRKSESVSYEAFIKAITDQDGNYRFNNLAAGTYDIYPSVPAFVAPGVNQKIKSVIVGEDESVDGINFSLVRGGVITGKVTDAEGRALIQQEVSLYRVESFERQQPGVQRQLFSVAATGTDDRGIYRMYGLEAGKYKVAAGRGDEAIRGIGVLSRSTYKRVFHPDVTEAEKATVVEVKEGSEVANVDITLGRAMQTFSVSGRVVDGEMGTTIPNIRMGLQRSTGQRFEMISTQVIVNRLGDFLIEGLIPGKYAFFLFQTPSQNPFPDLHTEAVTFDVVDQDLSNVTVKLIKGASMSGVIVLETDEKTALQKFQEMQLRAQVMAPGGPGFSQSVGSPIGVDGSFRLVGLSAGIVSFHLSSPQSSMISKGFVITRTERDGVVQPPRGIEIKEGEQLNGLRVIVSYGNAKIRGVVKFENGSMPQDASILVRVTKPGEKVSPVQPPRVDARGQFFIEALPAGVYELHVTLYRPNTKLNKNVKQEVTLQDGVVTEVVVTFDLGPSPN